MAPRILFFKGQIKDQPGYLLRIGPHGKRRWMRIAFGQRPGLFALPPVPVIAISGQEFGVDLTNVSSPVDRC